MAGMRPGGMSDDEEYSDEEDFIVADTIKYSEASSARSNQSNGFANGFSGPREFGCSTDDSETNLTKFPAKSSCILKSRDANTSNDIPAVVSSTVDDLVNLDDLRSAIIKNNVPAVEKVLSYGVDIDCPLSSGWTAIMYAAHSSATECIRCLLRHGANPNSHKDNYNALMAACGSTCDDETSMLASVNMLLESGADVNASDRHNMTPLMYAARQGRGSVVETLLPSTADINQQDDKGYTALMWASNNGHIKVVQVLLKAGVDLSKRKPDGKRAVDIAASKGRREILELLQSSDVSSVTADSPFGVIVSSFDAGSNATLANCSTTAFCGSSRSSSVSVAGAVSPFSELAPSISTQSSLINFTCQSNTSSTNCLGDLAHQVSATSANCSGDGFEMQINTVHTPASTSSIMPQIATPSVSTYGELEVFLSGLDLGSLIPTFQQQKVTFTTFLRLTDVDLQQMGVDQLGVRKKILDAIRETHKKNWETTSLASIQYNKKISCADSVVMLANIKQHAAYVASTIGYITDQISADNKIVLDAPENGVGVKDLCINTEEAIANVKNLFAELVVLRKHLEKICHNREFQPPELIPKRRRRKSRYTWRRLIVFGGFVAGCTTVAVLLGKNLQR